MSTDSCPACPTCGRLMKMQANGKCVCKLCTEGGEVNPVSKDESERSGIVSKAFSLFKKLR